MAKKNKNEEIEISVARDYNEDIDMIDAARRNIFR